MKLLQSLVLSIAPGVLYACNVCGGSANSQNLGVLPQFNKHFLGVQYSQKSFGNHMNMEDQDDGGSRDRYQSVQLWGRYTINERIQLLGFLPYSYNTAEHEGRNASVKGLGDVLVVASYRLIASDDCGPVWKTNLQLGGGVKMPTGSYDHAQQNGMLPNMQPGTGSWDGVVSLSYSTQYRKVGIAVDMNYTVNSENRDGYKFGNRLTVSALGYYALSGARYNVLPLAGLRIENYATDFENYHKRWVNNMTGGDVAFATLGVQAFYGQLGFNFAFYQPVFQKYRDEMVSTGQKTEIGVQFLF